MIKGVGMHLNSYRDRKQVDKHYNRLKRPKKIKNKDMKLLRLKLNQQIEENYILTIIKILQIDLKKAKKVDNNKDC